MNKLIAHGNFINSYCKEIGTLQTLLFSFFTINLKERHITINSDLEVIELNLVKQHSKKKNKNFNSYSHMLCLFIVLSPRFTIQSQLYSLFTNTTLQPSPQNSITFSAYFKCPNTIIRLVIIHSIINFISTVQGIRIQLCTHKVLTPMQSTVQSILMRPYICTHDQAAQRRLFYSASSSSYQCEEGRQKSKSLQRVGENSHSL